MAIRIAINHRTETQDIATFADGILNTTKAQKHVALANFEDDAINDTCPPFQAILHIMAHVNYRGKTTDATELWEMFRALINSGSQTSTTYAKN